MPRGTHRATHEYAGIAARAWLKAPEIRCYADVDQFLGDKFNKKLASNMQVVRLGMYSVHVVLYETTILVYHSDGTFEASNGGWNTRTTVNRLDQFGPKAWRFFHSKKLLWGWVPGTRQEEQLHMGKRLFVFPSQSVPPAHKGIPGRVISSRKSHDGDAAFRRRTQVRRLSTHLLRGPDCGPSSRKKIP